MIVCLNHQVNIVTAMSKKNSFEFFGCIKKTFDLRPDDLSIKGLEMFPDNIDAKKRQPIQFLFDQWQKS